MKKKLIIGSIIAVIIISAAAASIIKNKGGIPAFGAGNAVEVSVKKIERGHIEATISASGTIEEIEKSEIYFDTPLKVKKINVEKNQKVTKGQKLVELDLDTLISELEQAKINKSVQELAIQKIRPGGVASTAENNIRTAENAYNDSKRDYENSKALLSTGAISQNDLDKAERALKDAEIALKNARLGLTSQSVDVMTQEQTLRATILKVTDIENRLKKINDLVVSPIDGMVSEINIVDGSFTSSAQPSFKIVNPGRLRIKADVKEFNIKSVSVGQNVKISGDAIDKKDGVSGRVSSISPAAKKTRNSSNVEETLIEVMIDIENGHPVLKPGLSVTCEVITQVKDDVLIANFEMFKEDKDGNRVILVFDPSKGEMREKKITLGATSELDAEVVSGLEDGELAILEPQPNYKDGARAKVKKEDKK